MQTHRDEQLEREADQWLEAAGAFTIRKGANHTGLYTNKQLHNLQRRELTNYGDGLGRCPKGMASEVMELSWHDIDEFGDRASLSDRQRIAWDLYLRGLPQTDIAIALDLNQSTISRDLAIVRHLLALEMLADPFYGWWQVYLSELRRRHKAASGGNS